MASTPTSAPEQSAPVENDFTSREGTLLGTKSTSALGMVVGILRPLASLRLTVTLFALSIVLILIGTLAQVEKDMWQVIVDYFRAWICKVEFRLFFPKSFFPQIPRIPGFFYFPGGALLGLLLAINLAAAHLLRFKVQAKGTRLLGGFAVLAAGAVVTWLIISAGHNTGGLQGLPLFEWSTLWTLIKLSLIAAWAGLLVLLFKMDRSRSVEFSTVLGIDIILGAAITYLFVKSSDVVLSDSSLRILWQLIQATFAAGITLIGCILLFKKRGGVALIHIGVGLLMFSELWVALMAVEQQIQFREGQTVNFARDVREVELAFVDVSNEDNDEIVAVPSQLLTKNERVRSAGLPDYFPFEIEPVKYYRNALLNAINKPDADNLATAGSGLQFIAKEARASDGTSSGAVDMAAAYVKLIPKDAPEKAETYLFSQFLGDGELLPGVRKDEPERIVADGREFQVSLRFRRNYKPYSITLVNVVKEDYLGTETPRDYSSFVHFVKPESDTDFEHRIWMNNPMRFAGETFYQSGYNRDRFGEYSTLQVVSNLGWMIPYVACMYVAVGLLCHFSATLIRFLDRLYTRSSIPKAEPAASPEASRRVKKRQAREPADEPSPGLAGMLVPAVTIALCVVWLVGRAAPSKPVPGEFDFDAFGTIPIVDKGRVKPIDTLARNTLTAISNKQNFTDGEGNRQPAVKWLLDVVTQADEADDHHVFRVENPDVLSIFHLSRRKGYRYSVAEFRDHLRDFESESMEAQELFQRNKDAVTTVQRKVLELATRLRTFMRVRSSFEPDPPPELPTPEEMEKDPEGTRERFREMFAERLKRNDQLMAMGPPMAVPVKDEDDEETWVPYAVAVNMANLHGITGREVAPATSAWNGILRAYAAGNASAFNHEVGKYLAQLKANPPQQLENQGKVPLEFFFNRYQPFMCATVLYVFAFIFACLGWLVWRIPLHRTAFWLLLLTFGFHTFCLVGRIYISGRPPVTNLYSSAVFVAWGGVALGLIIEAVYKMGFGSVAASVCGFASLLIAGKLAAMGDTFTVLQAVLDTQFWLATHVVCVTMGYAATFMAGILGMGYVAMMILDVLRRSKANQSLIRQSGKDLSRMIYGILCFALFFSFFGTVLGGLWADDSWGRFWGWDPKENGALIIVLWNALILHARWGAMVKDRGLALLAVGGNIATSWSWFGVNELGVGLHSYGFTEGVLLALGLFVASQVAIIIIGLLPWPKWQLQ